MRSQELDLDAYQDAEKVTFNILKHYDPIFSSFVEQEIKLLEIGVYRGGSLLLWRDYFPKGVITGIDIKLPKDLIVGERIHIFQGSQDDPRFLTEVANKMAPEGFDIIIDDASHIGVLTKSAFWHLFENHLKAGGIYAIEDWGTGYLKDYHDGKAYNKGKPFYGKVRSTLMKLVNTKRRIPIRVAHRSHNYGMVGFIKELVDEQGARDLTKRKTTGTPERESKFESMHIIPDIVFVKKARH